MFKDERSGILRSEDFLLINMDNNASKKNNLRELRLAAGITQEALGERIGVGKAAISKYERGALDIPLKHLAVLCDVFSVSADRLIGRKGESESLSQTVRSDDTVSVPIVGRVHAGSPILADENIREYVPLSAGQISSGTYFYMEVEGDCMTGDLIPEGALVLVRQQKSVQNGQIAVIRLEDEVMLRHVKYENGYLLLVPSNPAYDTTIVTGGDVEIVGRVVEVRFSF